jgi:hypothetical protein
MKTVIYFSHDCQTRSDNKIQELIFRHGMQGYGVFWAIVENLYINANAMPQHYNRIAFDLRVDEKLVQSVIEDFDLFQIHDQIISSNSVEKRLQELNIRSEKAKEKANKRWGNATAMPQHSQSNAIKEKKRKEKKVNEIKRKEINKENTYPQILEVEKFFFENGFKREAGKKAFEYYSEAGWKDSKGSQVKNWKQKMRGVWFKDENKISNSQTPKMVY